MCILKTHELCQAGGKYCCTSDFYTGHGANKSPYMLACLACRRKTHKHVVIGEKGNVHGLLASAATKEDHNKGVYT